MKYLKIALIVLAAILLTVVMFVAIAFAFGFEEILPFVNNEPAETEATLFDEPSSEPEDTKTEETTGAPEETTGDEEETTGPVETDTTAADTTETETETETDAPVTTPKETETQKPETAPVTTPPETKPVTTNPVTTKPKPETSKPKPKPESKPVTTKPNLKDEGSALEQILKPAQITVLKPTHPGTLTKSNANAIVDYSNTADGYVMVKFLKNETVRLKVQVNGPAVKYTYNVNPGEWTVFPLSDGNGSYTVNLFKNVVDNRYTTVLSCSFTAKMKNEFAPFLRPNQYVNYENEPLTAATASKVVNDGATNLEKVKAVYDYVVKNISYDYEKAATVQSGYLPDLDTIIKTKKGICFDYAALMTGMLRSLNVPCKLVVGYAGVEYHAWISVWSEEKGWIDGAIFFNGTNWQTMDPTYAASGAANKINKVQYTSKYVY